MAEDSPKDVESGEETQHDETPESDETPRGNDTKDAAKGFGPADAPTAKVPSLKKRALLKRDAERHRDGADEEE